MLCIPTYVSGLIWTHWGVKEANLLRGTVGKVWKLFRFPFAVHHSLFCYMYYSTEEISQSQLVKSNQIGEPVWLKTDIQINKKQKTGFFQLKPKSGIVPWLDCSWPNSCLGKVEKVAWKQKASNREGVQSAFPG